MEFEASNICWKIVSGSGQVPDDAFEFIKLAGFIMLSRHRFRENKGYLFMRCEPYFITVRTAFNRGCLDGVDGVVFMATITIKRKPGKMIVKMVIDHESSRSVKPEGEGGTLDRPDTRRPN